MRNKSIFDKIGLESLVDIDIEGINIKDYPDFCNAYISSASFGSKRILSEEELNDINENHRDFVYDCVLKQLY